ncbi:uncharacterized protein DSM5745_08655 [Aspergillus mulundensis]|uniref:Uncharacterized protein n=1 Tax=Aspergillus mulundensis TaxID=1810919 RepID=A0A3D8R4B3_9EURO|nr:Uncharacterized protein DSM5745_08655 [Aspergillus mulundensis]RDW68895.1 Uncharacterized protein DSM5745_08655 [Aspergillus mulundensis]
MRLQHNGLTILVSLFFFMALVSAHTVHCAGKALAANTHDLADALTYLHWMAEGKLWLGDATHATKVHTLAPDSCEQIACIGGAEVRWCNEDPVSPRSMDVQHVVEGATVLLTECLDTYKGEQVAGGYLTHPDNWSVIVQEVEKCEGRVWRGKGVEA